MGHTIDPLCDTLLVLALPFNDADNPPIAGCPRILPKHMDRRLQTPSLPADTPNQKPWQHHLEAPIGLFVDGPSLSLSLSCNVVSREEEDGGNKKQINHDFLYYQYSSSAPSPCNLQYGASCLSPTSTSTITNSYFSTGGKRHRTDVDGSRGSKSGAEAEIEVDNALAPATAADRDEGITAAATGKKNQKKLKMTKGMVAILEEEFEKQTTLNPLQKDYLAIKLGIEPRQVEVWFQNRRARNKQKQTELDCDALREYCKNLDDENRRLRNELRELHSAIRFSAAPTQATATPPAHQALYMISTTNVCPACHRITNTAATAAVNNAAGFAVPPKSAQVM